MRALWAVGILSLALGGCVSSRLVQRDGCWVRHSEGFPGINREEIGPCARPQPEWSSDRLARLVQECMAEADYRWETEALAAWNKGQPLPAQATQESVMKACMSDPAIQVVGENERLQKELAQVMAERDALRATAQQDLDHLRAAQDRMTDALGEAAKKPAPSAYAASVSSGTANTDSEQSTASEQLTRPGAPAVVPLPMAPDKLRSAHPLAHAPSHRAAPPACGQGIPGDGTLCAPPKLP